MSTAFFVEIVERLSPRNLIERSSSKDDGIFRCDLSLGAQIPSAMDEVRRPEYPDGASVLVAAKTNEVQHGTSITKEASESFDPEAS